MKASGDQLDGLYKQVEQRARAAGRKGMGGTVVHVDLTRLMQTEKVLIAAQRLVDWPRSAMVLKNYPKASLRELAGFAETVSALLGQAARAYDGDPKPTAERLEKAVALAETAERRTRDGTCDAVQLALRQASVDFGRE